MWEIDNLSAAEIARRIGNGTTKNMIVGLVYRRGWLMKREPRRPYRTFDERISALHAKLDAVLAENVGVGHRVASEKEDVRLLDRTGWKPTWGHPRERRAR